MIIAVLGQKGGTGKTTTAINLAAEARRRGKRALLVDADPQRTSLTWAGVAGEKGHGAPTTVWMDHNLARPDQLPAMAALHDFTVIDGPPRAFPVQRAALKVADVVVMPCGQSHNDIWAMAETLDLLNEELALRPALKAYVLITRARPNTVLGKSARAALSAGNVPVLNATLTYRAAYEQFTGSGLGITEYAPRDPAAGEIRALFDELFPETTPKVNDDGQQDSRAAEDVPSASARPLRRAKAGGGTKRATRDTGTKGRKR